MYRISELYLDLHDSAQILGLAAALKQKQTAHHSRDVTVYTFNRVHVSEIINVYENLVNEKRFKFYLCGFGDEGGLVHINCGTC